MTRMDVSESRFRYFQDPHHFSTYQEDPEACDLCGRIRAGYGEPFWGSADIGFVCEDCLAGGRLAELEATINSGDQDALRRQLEQLYSELPAAQIEALAQQRTAELEYRTPGIVTWQYFLWPAHCGDYCRFIKEVGQPDLNELALDGDGPAFFAQHLYEGYENTDVPAVWQSVRPDSPADAKVSYSVGVYLFRCLHCGEFTLLWDCD